MGTNLDIVIVTALEEEAFPLRRFIEGEYAPRREQIADLDVTFLSLPHSNIRVGLCSFDQMGCVAAAERTSGIIDETNPACIFLTGIAAGRFKPEKDKKTFFNLADIGIAKSVVYSSWGSVADVDVSTLFSAGVTLSEEETGKLVDTALRKVEPKVVKADVLGCIRSVSDPPKPSENGWREMAQRVFKSGKGWPARYRPEHPQQDLVSAHNQLVREAGIASGEVVIRSPRFQEMVWQVYYSAEAEKKHPLRFFDMEAYGVALACERQNVRFGVVKGISDLGDKDKGDAARLSAIAGATAFTWCCVTSDKVPSMLTNAREAQKKARSASRPCLWRIQRGGETGFPGL